MTKTQKIRSLIFLKDVLITAFTAFGGPQAHIAMFFKRFVEDRAYLTEEELIELNALCQLLPGPTSTQTITAIGFRVGGVWLGAMTLLLWAIPAVTIMTLAGISLLYVQDKGLSLNFTRFIQPMAIGFISFAAFKIIQKVIKTKLDIFLMLMAGVVSFFFHQPIMFPIIIIVGGCITATQYKQYPKGSEKNIKVKWHYLTLFVGIYAFCAILTKVFDVLPVRLFENFYRDGALIFGGGQVLVPWMLTEFVHVKELMSSEEFMSGYAFSQTVPGPTFSFAAFVGALCMREYDTSGEVLGALIGSVGVFLPGALLIFFVIQFWDELKKYRGVRASLEGVNATSSGLVLSAVALMLVQVVQEEEFPLLYLDFVIMVMTFVLLKFTKIPPPIIVLVGLALGLII